MLAFAEMMPKRPNQIPQLVFGCEMEAKEQKRASFIKSCHGEFKQLYKCICTLKVRLYSFMMDCKHFRSTHKITAA